MNQDDDGDGDGDADGCDVAQLIDVESPSSPIITGRANIFSGLNTVVTSMCSSSAQMTLTNRSVMMRGSHTATTNTTHTTTNLKTTSLRRGLAAR